MNFGKESNLSLRINRARNKENFRERHLDAPKVNLERQIRFRGVKKQQNMLHISVISYSATPCFKVGQIDSL